MSMIFRKLISPEGAECAKIMITAYTLRKRQIIV